MGANARPESSCGADPLPGHAFTILQKAPEFYAENVDKRALTVTSAERPRMGEYSPDHEQRSERRRIVLA